MGITSSTALWYASRATGVVALVLLTAVMVLGIMVTRKRSLPGLPRFGTTNLHRSLSLLAVLFVAVHVITAIADPFVTIGIAASVIPFTSPYETLWVGLGAVSLDLMAAMIVTSLLRARVGRRTWRAVHWLSYAAWPVALLHSIWSSKDFQHGWLLWVGIGCAAAVLLAAGWRTALTLTKPRRAELPALTLARIEQQPRHAAPGQGARRDNYAGTGAR